MGWITKKRGRWCFRYLQDGRERQKQMPSWVKTKREAQALCKKWSDDLAQYIERVETLCAWTMKEAKERYLDSKDFSPQYRQNLDRYWIGILERWPEETLVSEISKGDVLNWIDDLRKEKVTRWAKEDGTGGKKIRRSNSTIRHYVFALSGAMELAVSREVLDKNPCRGIDLKAILPEKPAKQPRGISDQEFKELWDHSLSDLTKHYLLIAWATGGRMSEILSLEWNDLDPERGLIHFRHEPERGRRTKAKKDRSVPVAPSVVAWILANFPHHPKSTWIFHSEDGSRIKRVQKGINAAARRAGLDITGTHVIRHTVGSRLLEKGVPLSVVRDHLGHADYRMTSRYTHTQEEARRHAAELIHESLMMHGSLQDPGPNPGPEVDLVAKLWESDEFVSAWDDLVCIVERETGLEPATLSLGMKSSTREQILASAKIQGKVHVSKSREDAA